jgi:ketosteroid isomerase-like protein
VGHIFIIDTRGGRVVDAVEFSQHWVSAWNAHDVDAVLEHFHDDVVFTSPTAAELFPQTQGVLRGRDALREYWSEGVRRIPDLHFSVVGVYEGIDTVVINFRNQRGDLVSEVLIFDGDLVRYGHGTYRRDSDSG